MNKEKRGYYSLITLPMMLFFVVVAAVPLKADTSVVIFHDDNLRTAVRDALNKPDGDITDSDMKTLITLNASWRNIQSLDGLEHATNLQTLYLEFNNIGNISKLSDLTNLKTLQVSNNSISGLSALQTLDLHANPFSGSDLINLTQLQEFYLAENNISDIAALPNLTNLQQLDVSKNFLDLAAGSQSMNDIDTLINKGVNVMYQSQKEGQFNGSYYKVINKDINWEDAKNEAETLTHDGIHGHLATITSDEENAFVISLTNNISNHWLGGFQPDGSTEPDGGWQWVTGELWNYHNWNGGEPNDDGKQDLLIYNNDNGKWDDNCKDATASGYIVEFDNIDGYTISMNALTDGSITANPNTATAGTAINLIITPEAGMQLIYAKDNIINQPFSIQTVVFNDNQTVDKNKLWTIKFNQTVALDDNTKNGITIIDSNGTKITCEIQFGSDKNTIKVVPPVSGYSPGESYTLNIDANVHSQSGQALKNNCLLHFNIKTEEVNNVVGNTATNLINYGIAAIQGDWIYYRNQAEFGNLYKINKNDTTGNGIKLNDDNVYFINVVGSYIYYVNYDSSICRIRTDGTERQVIRSVNPSCMQVIGEDIYFTTKTGTINKMKIDGSNMVDLKLHGDKFIINNDWIFYSDYNGLMAGTGCDYSEIYKAKLDGSHSSGPIIKVNEYPYIITSDDIIYYVQPKTSAYSNDGKNIMRASLNGSSQNSLFLDNSQDYGTYCLNSDDKCIYYTTGTSFSKINMNGTGKEILTSDFAMNINIVGDWIYYSCANNVDYKVKTDGTCYREVDEE